MSISPAARLACAVFLAAAAVPALVSSPSAQNAVVATRFTPSHVAVAREAVVYSGLSRTFDGVTVDLAVQIMQTFGSTRPDLAKDLQDSIVSLKGEIEGYKTEILDLSGRLFAEKLTEAELKDVTTFLKSPTGQKYVAAQPEIVPDFETLTRDWGRRMSEKLIVRVREEMKKKGHEL